MTDSELKEFNILFPTFLREAAEKAAKRNRRSISAEITVAAERYIAANAEDGPPEYHGNLKRTKIWIPKDVHQAVSDLAESRNWSMNQVFMAAAAWHVRQKKGSAMDARRHCAPT